jgi:two-component system, response regulator PdtaR
VREGLEDRGSLAGCKPQDRLSTALIFPFTHFGTTLVRVGTLCMLAGDFVAVPEPLAALAHAPDDSRLRNAGRPTQEHASVDNPVVILLVEDEVLVRMVAADVLSDAGFTILESTNAEEALRLLETRSDVQVLFTDVNMPGAPDGLGLAQTVHNRSPEVGILIGSGRIRPSPAELPPGTRFIEAVCPRCPHRRRTCGGPRTAGEGRTFHARSLMVGPLLRRKQPTSAAAPSRDCSSHAVQRTKPAVSS